MQYARETICCGACEADGPCGAASLRDDMHRLIRAYYSATPAHTGLPEYNFNWPLYEAMEKSGQLLVLTARDAGALIGFAIYVVTEHPHHRGWQIAECDTIAVAHTARGQGIGRTLLEAALGILKNLGVKTVAQRYRTCYNTTPLFSELGFTCAEHVYVKEL